jgi:hypothetical protein
MEQEIMMKRPLYRLVAALAVIGMLVVLRPHSAAAAGTTLRFGPDKDTVAPHGDYQLNGWETYYTNGGKDLVFAESDVEGNTVGGSPVFFEAICLVVHNFVYNPGSPTLVNLDVPPVPGTYTTADMFGTRFGLPAPPGSYISGFGIVSGPDVSETGTNTAGAYFGTGSGTFNDPLLGPLTDRVAISQAGWMYYNTVIDTITGGGTETITAQGQGIHSVNVGGGVVVLTPETGALQCQIGPSAGGLNLDMSTFYYSGGDAEGF